MQKYKAYHRWSYSLSAKLFLAFALVATLGIGTVATVAYQVMARQFTLYVSGGRQARAERWAQGIAESLRRLPPAERPTAWANIEDLLENTSLAPGAGQGRGQGRGLGLGREVDSEDRILILAPDGHVLYDSGDEWGGRVVDASIQEYSTPIVVDGQAFGAVLIARPDLSTHSALERQFLTTINGAVIWAALLAALASVVVVALLSRQLVAPLRQLTAAAEAMASGDLSQRVTVKARDEVGELGRAFNGMAKDLQAADTQRRQMTADIAHELRNPLSVIRGNIEAMLEGIYPIDAQHLTPVYEETLLLQRLVQDLRLLSLTEAGQLTLTRTNVDAVALLGRVADSVRAVASDKGISVHLETSQDRLVLNGDETRLRQVLSNLVDNAIRHTPSGGDITLHAQQEADRIEISISDTGPGISPQDLPRIFDRFYRGDAARDRASGGSGLGLAIAQALVLAHGGTIAVESEPGQGAQFTIALPIG